DNTLLRFKLDTNQVNVLGDPNTGQGADWRDFSVYKEYTGSYGLLAAITNVYAGTSNPDPGPFGGLLVNAITRTWNDTPITVPEFYGIFSELYAGGGASCDNSTITKAFCYKAEVDLYANGHIVNGVHYKVEDFTPTRTNSSFTNRYGFWMRRTPNLASTRNYGFYYGAAALGDEPSGNYSIYTDTDPCWFNNKVTIGKSLDINNTAPVLTMTDTTSSAKSLKMGVDADIAQIREKAGANYSLMTFDLANNKIGIAKNPTETEELQIFKAGSGNALRLFDLTISEVSASRWISFKLNSTVTGNPCTIDFDPQPPDNSSSLFRFFRNVNTTASVYFQVMKGDGTSTVNHTFCGKGGDSYVCANNGNFGVGTTSPAATAILDLTSTTKGALLPRMTTAQQDAISNPATGLQIYNTDLNKFSYYNGTLWKLEELDPSRFINLFQDFIQASILTPWQGTALASGSFANDTGNANHPGVSKLSSHASNADSGYSANTGAGAFLLAGYETTTFVFKTPSDLTNVVVRMGFLDSFTDTAPTDGVWVEMNGTALDGRTSSNSSASDTTDYGTPLSTDTWYRVKIVLNSDATRVDFYLYNESGTQLWTDNLTTNIPTASDRMVGHAIIAYYGATPGSAISLLYLDYMDCIIPRKLTR
ncbi:MAG: hypothetical protein HYW14_04275, partial [Planctomycetes bacterium]|nr:hypothetical protein [Planctomycetota bacterium]